MGVRIKPEETAARGIRRIARTQMDKAIDALERGEETGFDVAVHTARKQFKRVRALIRLASDGLGRDLSTRENLRFRDAGRPLSEVRDAEVLIQTLDRLVQGQGEGGQTASISAAREFLVQRKMSAKEALLDEGERLSTTSAILARAHSDVKRWKIRRDGWDAFALGLKRIYRQGLVGFHQASDAPTDESLHEWRKRVKDLWYALEVLRPIRPGFTRPRIELARRLAETLGDDHDLAVLGLTLGELASPFQPRIDTRRAELGREAMDLGRVLYDQTPSAFAERFRAYWRAWRAEFRAARLDPPLESPSELEAESRPAGPSRNSLEETNPER